ncbi:MAG TPA: hypothetical protein VG537_02480 [Candidatus Kapabacteria bacterium]|jgi:hypothetical protein|nr:hypothetical protein [Candidatus Kapabacteria bacterium]
MLYSAMQSPITPAIFSQRFERAEVLKIMNAPVLDSTWERDRSGHDSKVLVFAPIDFMGIPSMARAYFTKDSLDRIEFYFPYKAHEGIKPFPPYGTMGFTHATANDLANMESSLTNIYGVPSVLAPDFFEYFADGDHPYITGKYEAATVVLSITPSPPAALRLKARPQPRSVKGD